jgi:hypothetical protein
MPVLSLSSAKLYTPLVTDPYLPYRKAKELLSQNYVSQCQITVSVILRNFVLEHESWHFEVTSVSLLWETRNWRLAAEESACSSVQFLAVEQPQ